jgi:DNA repair protein RadC
MMTKICTSYDTFLHLSHLMTNDVEEFWIMALHNNKQLIKSQCLFRGTVNQCPVFPRDIVRFICAQNASAFIVVHNHPSGDATPSRQDVQLTKKLLEIAALIEVVMIDHVIIGDLQYYSFADKKISNY